MKEKWQPIETAPKDGTWIALWSDGSKVQAGYWGPSYFGSDHKWIQYAHRSECEEVEPEPTHWQPLPEPPAQPTTGEGE